MTLLLFSTNAISCGDFVEENSIEERKNILVLDLIMFSLIDIDFYYAYPINFLFPFK